MNDSRSLVALTIFGLVKARALDEILTMKIDDRLPVLAQGLALLEEHVETLRLSTKRLVKREQHRAAAILDAVAVEEAAKCLILLDLARVGWADQQIARRQVGYFSNHVARGIYAEVASGTPASFGEVRQLVDFLRASRYLDGPNDVDWIFRNPIEAKREETFYVDYIKEEEGCRWVTPESGDNMPLWGPSPVTRLVRALSRAGLFTEPGLELISSAWSDAAVDDQTHWQYISSLNRTVLQAASAAQLFRSEITKRDIGLIVEHWSFPLSSLDLRKRIVTDDELQIARKRGEELMLRDWYGDDYDSY